MKLRILRTTYAAGQRLADAKGTAFCRWAASAIRRHGPELADATPAHRTDEAALTRSNSVSVFVALEAYDQKTSRACIRTAIRLANAEPWPYRYDRATLRACITTEQFFGRTCDMDRAQDIMDQAVSRRKKEIAARKGRK